MASLDVEGLLTNIPFKETIENNLFLSSNKFMKGRA